MKKIKKIASILLCVTMMLTFCACGGEGNGVAGGKKNGEYTLSEYLSSGTTIWYAGSSITKNTVATIFVMEPDGNLYVLDAYYGDYSWRDLGTLSQMEDSEIASKVKEEYKKRIAADGSENIVYAEEAAAIAEILELLSFDGHGVTNVVEGDIQVEKDTFYETYQEWGLDTLSPYIADAFDEEWKNIEAYYAAWAAFGATISTKRFAQGLYAIAEPMFLEGASADEIIAELVKYREEFYEIYIADSDVEKMEKHYGVIPIPEKEIRTLVEAMPLLEEAATNIYHSIMKKVEEQAENVEPAQYRLAIETDSTGNKTESMILAYVVDTPNGQQNKTIYLYYDAPVQSADGELTNCCYEVYDSLYGGYRYGQKGSKFYTQVEKGLHFVLDEVGESDLPVDVKDIKTLFE